MEWINVKDKLPENIGHYLISDGIRVGEASWLKRTSLDTFWFRFTSIENITHWMPLPEPPKPQQP